MTSKEKINIKTNPQETDNDSLSVVEAKVRLFCGDIVVGWWSGGITSAVACWYALKQFDNLELFYIETGAAEPDTLRFKKDCEHWYGKSIHHVMNSKGYKNPVDVVLKTRYVNGVNGARCSTELKKLVRLELEEKMRPDLSNPKRGYVTNQIMGFEWTQKEVNRAIRFLQQFPEAQAKFPLIERHLNKNNCASILANEQIDLPLLYKKGYNNNNCIGCIKGGKGYWNKIKIDYPEVFKEMATAERIVGHSCIKDKFLDELNPEEGRGLEPITAECGVFCKIDKEEIPVHCIDDVMEGKITVYEASMLAA